MLKLFASKKRKVPADEDLESASSAGTVKGTAEYEAKKIKSDTEPLADQNPNASPRLGVRILHEPSDPKTAVVE